MSLSRGGRAPDPPATSRFPSGTESSMNECSFPPRDGRLAMEEERRRKAPFRWEALSFSGSVSEGSSSSSLPLLWHRAARGLFSAQRRRHGARTEREASFPSHRSRERVLKTAPPPPPPPGPACPRMEGKGGGGSISQVQGCSPRPVLLS